MLEFIRSVYRGFVVFAFWAVLIGFVIGGGIIGATLRSTGTGVVLGLIMGFIVDVLLFGFIATILNIDENLEIIRSNTSPDRHNSYLPAENSPSIVNKAVNDYSPIRSITRDDNSIEKKKCRKCNNLVSADDFVCPKCGSETFV